MFAATTAFVCGAAAGFGFALLERTGAAKAVKRAEARRPASATISDEEIRRMRERVKELERESADLQARAEAKASVGRRFAQLRAAATRMERESPIARDEARRRLEELHARLAAPAKSRLDLLEAIDTGCMDEGQRATHERLIAMLHDYEEKSAALHSEVARRESFNEQAALAKERDALADELHGLIEDIKATSREERANLLAVAANSLGFKGEEAGALAESVIALYDATDARNYREVGREVKVEINDDGSPRLVLGGADRPDWDSPEGANLGHELDRMMDAEDMPK